MNSERRIHKQLLNYWKELGKDGRIPLESDLNPEELKDVWDNCFIINTKNGKYSYLGKNLLAINEGKGILAKSIYDNFVCPKNSNLPSVVKHVVQSKEPVIQESVLESQYGVKVKYRRCFLPLSDSSNDVAYILGGFRWKSL